MATLGRWTRAPQICKRRKHLWRELGNQAMLADSLSNSGLWRMLQGDYTGSVAVYDEAFEISQRIQNVWGQAYSQSGRGIPRWHRGEYAAAIADFEAGADLADKASFLIGQILPRIQLALLYHEMGASHLGLALTQHVYQTVGEQVPAFASFVLSALAFFHLVAGNEEKADRYFARVEAARPCRWCFRFPVYQLRASHRGQISRPL